MAAFPGSGNSHSLELKCLWPRETDIRVEKQADDDSCSVIKRCREEMVCLVRLLFAASALELSSPTLL